MFIKSLTHFVFLPLVSPFKWSSRNQKLFLLLTDTLYLANSNCPISPHQPLAMLWPLHFVILQVEQFQILHISGSCSFGPSRQPYLTGEHFHSHLIKKESGRSLKAGMCPKSLSWIEEMTANYVVLAVDRVCMQMGRAYCNGDMYLSIYIFCIYITLFCHSSIFHCVVSLFLLCSSMPLFSISTPAASLLLPESLDFLEKIYNLKLFFFLFFIRKESHQDLDFILGTK